MSVPVLAAVNFGGPSRAPLLVCGPSLGTSVSALWSGAASQLCQHYRVIGFDLPGHGRSGPPADGFTIAELADAVHELVTAAGVVRYHYAGVSAGGAVGLELLLRHGRSLVSTALISTGAKIRTGEQWHERAASVRRHGTAIMVGTALSTWFADGFARREPATAGALLESLRAADREGYATVCEALAGFDVRDRLPTIVGDVTAIAGAQDRATPPPSLQVLAENIPGARYLELDHAAHLAPAEQPTRIAEALLTEREGARHDHQV